MFYQMSKLWTVLVASLLIPLCEGRSIPGRPHSLQARTKINYLQNIIALCGSIVIGSGAASTPVSANVINYSDYSENSDDFYSRWPYRNTGDFVSFIRENTKEGDTRGVLLKMDEFAQHYPMYKITPLKAKMLEDALTKEKAKNVLEIGSFFGYSATVMLNRLPADGHLTLIEGNAENVEVIKFILKQAFGGKNARLQQCEVIHGLSRDVLESNQLFGQKFDFVYEDHDKNLYLEDLLRLQRKQFLAPTYTIAADNVIFPGAPDFVEYVQSHSLKTEILHAPFERIGFETKWEEVDDAMSFSKFTSVS